ncbi:MAG: ABC transporter ATP-binding protein [Christensenellales bacterium]|jgi:oligopeptide transport system ATP-binding protein
MSILKINNLRTEFETKGGIVKAIRDVSLHVDEGEMVGIVGESGSGKTCTMLSLMGLLAGNGHVRQGEFWYKGENISPLAFSDPHQYEKKMRSIRSKEIAMIFQDPMTFLNPVLSIRKQLTEPLKLHFGYSQQKADKRAIELMQLVGIPSPEKRLRQYPFEFSGGMRQRIIIAIALSCNPKLVIADEPTTALDVTIQAQVLELIKKLQQETGTSVIMITHDLGVIATTCTRVIVMYGGQIVEEGTNFEIFGKPKHPYTLGLLNSINNPEEDTKALIPIPGSPPDLLAPPAGCPFVDRCTYAMRICVSHQPPCCIYSDTHRSCCWLEHPLAKEAR